MVCREQSSLLNFYLSEVKEHSPLLDRNPLRTSIRRRTAGLNDRWIAVSDHREIQLKGRSNGDSITIAMGFFFPSQNFPNFRMAKLGLDHRDRSGPLMVVFCGLPLLSLLVQSTFLSVPADSELLQMKERPAGVFIEKASA